MGNNVTSTCGTTTVEITANGVIVTCDELIINGNLNETKRQ